MHTVGRCICIVSLQFSDTMRNKNSFYNPEKKKSKSKWGQFSQLDKYNCLHKLHWLSYSEIHHSNKHKPRSGSWLKGCSVAQKCLLDMFLGFGLKSLVELGWRFGQMAPSLTRPRGSYCPRQLNQTGNAIKLQPYVQLVPLKCETELHLIASEHITNKLIP